MLPFGVTNSVHVSIIVPTFNRLNDLKLTLESLRAQSYRNFEVIVIDDGSTDGTHEFLSQNEFHQVRYIHLTKNVGESNAINVGFLQASHPFVSIVSSDDPQEVDWLLGMVTFISRNPGYIFYYPNLRIIDRHDVLVQEVQLLDWSKRMQLRKMICVASAGTIINFRDYEKPIELRNGKVKFPSDLIQFLNLIKTGNAIKVPNVFGVWRDHDMSLTNQEDQISRVTEFITVSDNWMNENVQEFQNRIDLEVARFSIRLQGIHMLFSKNRRLNLIRSILKVRALRKQIISPNFLILACFKIFCVVFRKSKTLSLILLRKGMRSFSKTSEKS